MNTLSAGEVYYQPDEIQAVVFGHRPFTKTHPIEVVIFFRGGTYMRVQFEDRQTAETWWRNYPGKLTKLPYPANSEVTVAVPDGPYVSMEFGTSELEDREALSQQEMGEGPRP